MKVNWIIEKHMFEEYEQKLVNTIKNSGHNCLVIDDTDWKFDFNKDIKNKFNEKDCVIFYGSLQLGRKIWNQTNFIPGIFLTIDNYECFKYYGYYGDQLVNSNYMMMGMNDILRNKQKIFEILHSKNWTHLTNEKIFIRPSNGFKTFTGQLLPWEIVTKKEDSHFIYYDVKKIFEKEFDILSKSYGNVDIDQLVLVAPEQKVREETRFVIVVNNNENEVIDGNIYMIDGELVKERLFDKKAFEYVKTVANNYTPDKAFTIDIAKLDDGTYKTLEIGSFCCAGLYNMDLEIVVNKINNLCIKEYNDYHNVI